MFELILAVIVAVLYYKIDKRLRRIETRMGIVALETANAENGSVVFKKEEVKTEILTTESSAANTFLAPKTILGEVKKEEKAERSLEELIGKRWLPLLGIGAVIIGVSFFLKYAFENDIIGVTGRVALGLLAGSALVGLGEYWSKKYEKYSWVLIGGGIALYYLSIYAAFSFYNLIGQPTAFGFMVAVTAFAAFLAVWHSAMPLMAVAMLGGYLTPFLLPVDKPDLTSFLLYCTVLNVGFLAVTAFRRWRMLMVIGLVGGFIVPLPLMGLQDNSLNWFAYLIMFDALILAVAVIKKWHLMNLLGLLGSMLVFAAWYGRHFAVIGLEATEIFLTILFVEYLVAMVAGAFVAKEKTRNDDLWLLTINGLWYFLWSYFLLKPDYESYLGIFTALMAAVYIGLAYLALFLKKDDSQLYLFLGGLSLLFLTLVFPIQLHGYWITIAWAFEAAALAALGAKVQNQKIRLAALTVLIFTLVRLFLFDSAITGLANYTIFINKRFFSYLIVIASIVLMQRVFSAQQIGTPKSGDLEGEKSLVSILASAANILFLIILSLEVIAFFNVRIVSTVIEQPSIRKNLEIQYSNNSAFIYDRSNEQFIKSFTNQRNASLSVLWSLYAAITLAFGMRRKRQYLRYGALILFGVTLCKVLFIDLTALPTLYRFISFIVVGVLLLVGAYGYQSNKSKFMAK